MIKFFRKLRWSSLSRKRLPKYLLYATGEIVLVVIGILIALQINNWNENRVKDTRNKIILTNLICEFESNKTELNSSIASISQVIKSLDSVLFLTGKVIPEISEKDFEILLEKTFVTPSWTPSSYVLDEMRSSGDLSNIKNNDLKQILFKWERDFSGMKSIEEGYDRYAEDYIEFIVKNGSVRNLDAIGGRIKNLHKSSIGKNELSLLNSIEFENRVENFYFLAYLLREDYQGLKKTMDTIIDISKKQIND